MATTGQAIQQSDLEDLATLANAKLSPVEPYEFGEGGENFQQEIDRIRSDLFEKILDDDTSPIFHSKDALVSSQQCVGINPCPLGDGRLYVSRFLTRIPESDYMPFLKDVEFWYAPYRVPLIKTDDVDVTAGDVDVLADGTCSPTLIRKLLFRTDKLANRNLAHTTTHVSHDFTIEADARVYVSLFVPIVWEGSGTAPDPEASGFSAVIGSGGTHVLSVISSRQRSYAETPTWGVLLQVWLNLTSGSTNVTFDLTATTDWHFDTHIYAEDYVTIQTVSPSPTDVDVIHPGAEGKKITIPEFSGDHTAYTVEGARGVEFVEIKPNLLAGVWIAKTLPVPALNPYLDSDFPPYVRQLVISPNEAVVNGSGLTIQARIAASDNYRTDPTGSSIEVANPRSGVMQPAPYIPEAADFDLDVAGPTTVASGGTISGTIDYPWWLNAPNRLCLNDPEDVLLTVSDSVDIYLSDSDGIDPDNPSSYQLLVTGTEVTSAAIEAEFGDSVKQVFYVIKNTGGTPLDLIRIAVVYSNPPEIYNAVEPSCGNVAAVWPVLRTTDDYPVYPMRNGVGLDPFRYIDTTSETVANNGTHNVLLEWQKPASCEIEVDPSGTLYVSTSGIPNPSNPATYDFTVSGTLTKSDIIGHYGALSTGTSIHVVWKNTTGASVVATSTRKQVLYADASAEVEVPEIPVFCPTEGQEYLDSYRFARGCGEPYSYRMLSAFTDSYYGTADYKMIPQRGYVIHSVLVRRVPVLTVEETDAHPSIYLPPNDLPEITATIGQYLGVAHTSLESVDKGTFTALTTVTIPEGELEARVNVFWPVVWGAPLWYQCTSELRVEALVSWQPIFHSNQYAQGAPVVFPDTEEIVIAHSLYAGVDPSATCFREGLKHTNYREPLFSYPAPDPGPYSVVQFPPSATAYNDLVAALNLL